MLRPIFNTRIVRILPIEAWLALLVFGFHLFFVLIVQDLGWDDGAITLSFARTLSGFGKIALTPYSEIVEGYSSTLWMLAMAAVHQIMHPGFSQFIRMSQISASLLCAVSAVMFFVLLRQIWDGKYLPALFVVTFLLFIQKPFLSESVNGMEMQAATVLALSLMLIISQACTFDGESHSRSYLTILFIASALSSLVRFEFLFYLLVASVALLRSSKKLALAIAVGGSAGFFANSVHRYFYFNDVLPNTIYAKRWPPYRSFQLDSIRSLIERLKDSLSGGFEMFEFNSFFMVLVFAVLALLAITAFNRLILFQVARQTLRNPPAAYALGFCVAVIFFSMVTGRNWGYASRMQLAAVPLLVLLACFWLRQFSASIDATIRSAIPAYLATALVVSTFVHFPIPDGTISGMKFNIIGIDPLSPDHEGFGVTPSAYRYTGQSVDRIRRLLGLKSIKFMAPDVGGLGLGSPAINVLDSALLTNRRLARAGYTDFPAYLSDQKPDVIETHGIWSSVTGIYKLGEFPASYSPLVVDSNWLYLRKDHLRRLKREGVLKAIDCGSECKRYRYRGDPVDEEYVAKRGYDREVDVLSGH